MKNIDLKNSVVGTNVSVPILGGGRKRYVNFDNGASTPALKYVWDRLEKFKDYYSSVHRGTGYKSIISTKAYDNAHEAALKFVGADPKYYTSILIKNSTEGINKLANRLGLKKSDVVLSSVMEHHSNDLPWRMKAKTYHIEIDDNGYIDIDDYIAKLKKYGKKIKLVAVSGASNVTGIMSPVRDMARMAHKIGAEFLLDAAQLAPHRKINIGKPGAVDSFDYLVYSAHKMYAPLGSGALIGPKKTFYKGDPDMVGGGVVNYVTLDEIQWAHLPDKEEAGSPNVIGAVALTAAIDFFKQVGFSKIAKHERELTKYALKRFSEYENITLYGPKKMIPGEDRVGAISFNIDGVYHAIAAAILSYEGGIAVRNGCFCAHPYIQRMLKMTDNQAQIYKDDINNHIRSNIPGMIRISFGLYNTKNEIDHFFKIIDKIVNKTYKGKYKVDRKTGEAYPVNFKFPAEPRF